jgi:hypothetical protein
MRGCPFVQAVFQKMLENPIGTSPPLSALMAPFWA